MSSGIDSDLLELARRAASTLDAGLAEILVQRLRRVKAEPARVVAARELTKVAYRDAIERRAQSLLKFVRTKTPVYEHLVNVVEDEAHNLLSVDRETALDALRWTRRSESEVRAHMEVAGALWARDRLGEFTDCRVELRTHVRGGLETPMDYLALFFIRGDIEQRFLELADAPDLLDALGPEERERVRALRHGLERARLEDLWKLSAP